jgi:hypothetical protein
MTNELHHCTKPSCWINELLDEGYIALWPLRVAPEQAGKYYVWNFYIRWPNKRGSHRNGRWLCEKHHKQVLAMWTESIADDLENMEVTEQWLTRVKSQMLRGI